MTLDYDQCVDVIKKYNAHVPAWSIAATMGITTTRHQGYTLLQKESFAID